MIDKGKIRIGGDGYRVHMRNRCEEILKDMDLPKDIMNQIDLLTSSINDYWSQYSDLIYRYALEDILAFLTER